MDGPWPAKVVFGGLAVAGGAHPVLGAGKPSGDAHADSVLQVTCTAVYCHGATLSGGTVTAPIWNAPSGAEVLRCNSCHGFPPAVMRNRQPHPAGAACGRCHSLTVSTTDDSAIAHPENHINGQLEVAGGGACHDCHGSATNDAPPKDTHGNTATSSMGVGAHQAHLQARTLANPITCNQCHSPVSSLSHVNGIVELTWGPLATASGVTPSFDPRTGACSNLWCHAPIGYGQARAGTAGGRNVAPTWTRVGASEATCGACHGIPPLTGDHAWHSLLGCDPCHAGYSTYSVAKATHINGRVDVGGSLLNASNYANGSCTPWCHGRLSWSGEGGK